jgi:hypothetical protein
MSKSMILAAAAALAFLAVPSSASANQCIPEGGSGRLVCPFVYFAGPQTTHLLTETITTTTVKKPKFKWHWHKPKPPTNSFKYGGSKFGGAKFGGSKFGGAKFGGAKFGGAKFGGPGFGGSKFAGAKFGAPKFGAPKFGAPQFGGAKFGGPGFGGSKFAGAKFGGAKFGGGFNKGFGPKGMSVPRGGKGGYGGHKFGGHHKGKTTTQTQTKQHSTNGRKGPSGLTAYALSATWCSAGSLVLNALIINATENRELTRSEAGQTVAGCWLPIIGPLLVDAYYKANPQWAQ